jgi:hypothetical protein
MMDNKPISRLVLAVLLLALVVLLLGGCATMGEKPKSALVLTDRGTVTYEDKYEFKAPRGWKFLRNLAEGEGDFEFGFLKFEYQNGDYPSQTAFVYDAEPFGSSRDLETRTKRYLTRFLWLSGLFPEAKKQQELQLWGQPAILIFLEGENPNRGEKAESEVYLIKKGTRIISFACTQWRPLNGSFDSADFEQFEAFVNSFTFLQPTFYEELEKKIQKLKGDG